MNIEQVGLQLGIAGFVLAIGYKLAVLLIKNWRETESERTAIMADQFSNITSSVQRLAEGQAHMHGKLDQALGQTPAHGVRLVRIPNGDKEK